MFEGEADDAILSIVFLTGFGRPIQLLVKMPNRPPNMMLSHSPLFTLCKFLFFPFIYSLIKHAPNVQIKIELSTS
jgi:hypothetical protein